MLNSLYTLAHAASLVLSRRLITLSQSPAKSKKVWGIDVLVVKHQLVSQSTNVAALVLIELVTVMVTATVMVTTTVITTTMVMAIMTVTRPVAFLGNYMAKASLI